MRDFVLFSVFLSTVMAVGACSNRSSQEPSTASRPTAADPGRNLNTSNSPTMQNSAGNSPATDNANSNISLAERLENRRRRRPEADLKVPEAPLQFRAGPEDSEIATTMNADGRPVEIRIFKSDRKIARVESTWLDQKQRSLRITLKDGRVVEMRTNRFNSLLETSAEGIAALVDGR